MKIGLVQLRSGFLAAENFAAMAKLVKQTADEGAFYVQTPEMTNMLHRNRADLFAAITIEAEDEFVAKSRELAKELEIFLHLGSLALRDEKDDDKAVNRALVISPEGQIVCRYDKVHMFDVDLGAGNKWQESATYSPGKQLVVCRLGELPLGLGICYDVRFPALARTEAQNGAGVLSFPAAFTRVSGEAHWHTLLRARAIENGAFVVAAAQGGKHQDSRETFGHSLVYDPWGQLVGEIDHDEPDYLVVDIDLDAVEIARGKIPSLTHDRDFSVEQFDVRVHDLKK